MLDTFQDYQIRRTPILNEVTPTYKEVVPYLPTYSLTWQNARASVLTMKAVMSNWQLNSQWRAWNHRSTQLMRFNTPARSLDLSILDYQMELWSDWKWSGTPLPDIDGGTHFNGDPAKVGTYFTVLATRVLYYDIVWMADSGQENIKREIDLCRSIVVRAGYLCNRHYGERLA